MNILQRLTITNLRQNKRRTLVTILGVMLSTALILAVTGIVTSLQQMMIDFTIEHYGDFHDMYQEVPVEALKYIEENKHVDSYYYSEPLTTATVDEEMIEFYNKYQTQVYSAEYYQRLDQLPNDAKGNYNIFVRYDRPGDYKKIHNDIRATLEEITGKFTYIRTNDELLRYESAVMSDASLATLYSLAAIVIGIIIVTSVFVIRNSFSISAQERARQFGMLSSVGATPKQIRHSIIFEGIAIGAVGIPLGLILGTIAVVILVAIMNFLMSDMLETVVAFSMPFWVFPVAITLGFVTIFFSSLLPAIRTARMSPIEAIRGNNDIRIKAKKLRTPKFIKNIFGIGGVIASKNLKRSRKKYRTTVISLVISIATFIGLSSFLDYGKNMVGMQYENSNIDFVMQGGTAEFYQELQEKFDLKESAFYYSHMSSYGVPVTAMNHEAFVKFAKQVGVNAKDYSQVAIMNDYGLKFRDNGTYEMDRWTDLKDGEEYTAKITPEVPAKCQHVEYRTSEEWGDYDVTVTDEACVKAEGTKPYEVDLKITKLTNKRPLGFEGYRSPMILVSDQYYLFNKLDFGKRSFMQFFAANVDDVPAIIEYVDQAIEDKKIEGSIYYNDVQASVTQMRNMYILICIFLYGFVIVVMLIGVTNISNTITTNIALRAKEFAMLKSIGMTGSEFSHMIRLESLMYSAKALFIGLPLGLVLSYLIYLSFANSVDFGYILPWVSVLISIAVVALLVGAIMHYSVKQVEKQNIIETIRSENI